MYLYIASVHIRVHVKLGFVAKIYEDFNLLGPTAAAVNGIPYFNPYTVNGYNAVEGEKMYNCTCIRYSYCAVWEKP